MASRRTTRVPVRLSSLPGSCFCRERADSEGCARNGFEGGNDYLSGFRGYQRLGIAGCLQGVVQGGRTPISNKTICAFLSATPGQISQTKNTRAIQPQNEIFAIRNLAIRTGCKGCKEVRGGGMAGTCSVHETWLAIDRGPAGSASPKKLGGACLPGVFGVLAACAESSKKASAQAGVFGVFGVLPPCRRTRGVAPAGRPKDCLAAACRRIRREGARVARDGAARRWSSAQALRTAEMTKTAP